MSLQRGDFETNFAWVILDFYFRPSPTDQNQYSGSWMLKTDRLRWVIAPTRFGHCQNGVCKDYE